MRKVILSLLVAFSIALTATAQDRTITGKVLDDKGVALANVNILPSDGTNGTQTAEDGTFKITVSANAKSLTFSRVNYASVTQPIRTFTMTVVLSLSDKVLDDVVVTGISRVKKSQFTGAVSKIGGEELEDKPFGNFTQGLQGNVAGLISLTGSGAPGSGSTIIIRGTGSLQGGSEPLYVLDGIPIEAGVFQSLNPNDFQSIEILRDAASLALYGNRGSAGVVVITTKRGKAGKLQVGYGAQLGIKARPDFAFRPMTTDELLKTQENYGKIVGASASTTVLPGYYYSPANPRYNTLTPAQQAAEAAILDSIRGINTNWSDVIFRQGMFQNHQVSLSGGSGPIRMYSSLAFYQEEGTTLRTDMTRFSARNNLDYVDNKFSFQSSFNFGVTRRNFQQSTQTNGLANPFLSSTIAVPYHLPTNPDGSYRTGIGSKFALTNTLDLTQYDRNYNNQIKGTIGFVSGYKIVPSLTLGLTTGLDFRETQGTNYGSQLAFSRLSSTSITGKAGFQLESLDRFLTANIRPSLTFAKEFKDRHDIEASVVGEYITERAKFFSVTGFGSDPKRPNTIEAIPQSNAVNQLYPTLAGDKGTSAIFSGLATVRYTLDDKYTISGSYREDASSKLNKDNRWQNFYSIGATWVASKERFLENSNFINLLQLRASYGSAGNSNNFPGGFYPYQATYTGGTYSGINTIFATYPGNPDLKWETTFTTNLGADFELAKNKIYGNVNFYDRRTKDLFVQRPLSAVSGFGFLNVNAGELSNRGVELELNMDVIKRTNFVWTLYGNAAYNKNNIVSLGGEQQYEQGTGLIKVGQPVGELYEVKFAGIDASNGQPLYYDLNGNVTTTYSAANRVQDYGTYEAPYKGGFGTKLRFSGFDISTLFSFQQGNVKTDNLEFFTENHSFIAAGYNQSSTYQPWNNPGDLASSPSPLYAVSFSSKFIHDASFLRFRDITLGYTVPQQVLNASKIVKAARFYVQGSNLFLWTKWRGRDPEAGVININLSEFPNPRAVTAGLDINF